MGEWYHEPRPIRQLFPRPAETLIQRYPVILQGKQVMDRQNEIQVLIEQSSVLESDKQRKPHKLLTSKTRRKGQTTAKPKHSTNNCRNSQQKTNYGQTTLIAIKHERTLTRTLIANAHTKHRNWQIRCGKEKCVDVDERTLRGKARYGWMITRSYGERKNENRPVSVRPFQTFIPKHPAIHQAKPITDKVNAT